MGKKVRFSNEGWTPREGQTNDPVDSTSITNTRNAVNTLTVADFVAAISNLDPFTRQAVIDEVIKAYPNPNGTTAPNDQNFSTGRKLLRKIERSMQVTRTLTPAEKLEFAEYIKRFKEQTSKFKGLADTSKEAAQKLIDERSEAVASRKRRMALKKKYFG